MGAATAGTNALAGLTGLGGVAMNTTGTSASRNSVSTTSSIATAGAGRTAMTNSNLGSLHSTYMHSSIPSTQMNLQSQALQQQINASHSLPASLQTNVATTAAALQQHPLLSAQQEQMHQQRGPPKQTVNNYSMTIFQPSVQTQQSSSATSNFGFHNPLRQRALESAVMGQELARIEQENNLLSKLSSNLDSNIALLRQQQSTLSMPQQEIPNVEASRLRLLSLERQAAQVHAADLPVNPPAGGVAPIMNINSMLTAATRERTGISNASSTINAATSRASTIPLHVRTNATRTDGPGNNVTTVLGASSTTYTSTTQNEGRENIRAGLVQDRNEGNQHRNDDDAQQSPSSQRRRLR